MTSMVNINYAFENYRDTIYYVSAEINQEELFDAFIALKNAIDKDQQIFVCGNGGSAAIANHLSTDFFKGIRTSTFATPRVYSLCTNQNLISAIANDVGNEKTFSYQLETLMRPGDVLICISSSGNSPNIKEAVAFTTEVFPTNKIIGMSGFDKENFLNVHCDISLYVPSYNYGLVEDTHSMIMHTLSQTLRKQYAPPEVDTEAFTF